VMAAYCLHNVLMTTPKSSASYAAPDSAAIIHQPQYNEYRATLTSMANLAANLGAGISANDRRVTGIEKACLMHPVNARAFALQTSFVYSFTAL